MSGACSAGFVRNLDSRRGRAGGNGADFVVAAARHAQQLTGQMEALSPLAILDRGYALVFDSSGSAVERCVASKGGDEISARLAKGHGERDRERRKTELAEI